MPTKETVKLGRKACGVKLTGNFKHDLAREPVLRAMLSSMGRSEQWFLRRCENAERNGGHALLSVLEVAIDGGLDELVTLSSDPAFDYENNPKLRRAAQLAGFKTASSFGNFAKALLARDANPLHYLETKIDLRDIRSL